MTGFCLERVDGVVTASCMASFLKRLFAHQVGRVEKGFPSGAGCSRAAPVLTYLKPLCFGSESSISHSFPLIPTQEPRNPVCRLLTPAAVPALVGKGCQPAP